MKNFLKQNWLGVLSVVILLGAFWNHPYNYYQILRWVVAVSSIYYSYLYFSLNKKSWAWVFVATAVLFNPISPIYMQKYTWQKWDLVVAVVFLVSLFFNNKKHFGKE